MLIIPLTDEDIIISLTKDIKGNISHLDLSESQKNIILTYLSIYTILYKENKWITREDLEKLIECPCSTLLCKNTENCVYDE